MRQLVIAYVGEREMRCFKQLAGLFPVALATSCDNSAHFPFGAVRS
jgi:hypothetical protein